MMTPNTLDRSRKRKLKLLNLVKRGRIFYFKKRSGGQLFFESLHTDDETLAAERAKVKQQQLVAGELAKLREEKKAATLADIIAVHTAPTSADGKRVKMQRSLYCQCQAAWGMVKAVRGVKDLPPDQISLTELTPKLVRDYQDTMRQRYTAQLLAANPAATADELADVRDRADRSSKSLFKQAKNLFCKKHSRVERYREKGLIIPACVSEFCAAKAVGSLTSKVYLPPDDAALTRTFTDIDAEPHDGIIYQVFWAVIAFGGRRNEVMDMQVDDFAELDGELWIRGGRGKDKLEIQLPVINWPVHPASKTVPANVIRELIGTARSAGRSYLFAGTAYQRQNALPGKANAWLRQHGWLDEKKLHGLRAYIGSLIYSQDPHLAKDYLRHKSLLTTEQFYSHFFRLKKITRLQVVERVTAQPPLPPAAC